MFRLNEPAWKILGAEVERCTGNDNISGSVQRDIALKRLEKLRVQNGSSASFEELQEILSDILPNFPPEVLKKAAKINRPAQAFGKISLTIAIAATGLVGLAGLIWLVNLPYPMIRRPVAKVAPILLLPSYISMDRNYREAIVKVQQADQLVNQATSVADFELGQVKVKEAQENLDALPVWFLGYEPQFYCMYFSCSWRFTFDEFQAARASIGRMESKIFQEKNALDRLTQLEINLAKAKEDYQQSTTLLQQQSALDLWQNSMDELAQLPSATLAGKTAETKLNAYQRDFQQISGLLVGSGQTNVAIAAAKEFALKATQTCENPPHPVIKWEQCASLWQETIGKLQSFTPDDVGYLETQKLLATYKVNLGDVQSRKQTEAEATIALEGAQNKIEQFLASTPTQVSQGDLNRIISQLQGIINQLEKVQSGTTVYAKARELLDSAKQKMNQFQTAKIDSER
jgi:hypothetical protein